MEQKQIIENYNIVSDGKNGTDLIIEVNDGTLEVIIPKGTEIARTKYNVRVNDKYTQSDLYLIGNYIITKILGVNVQHEVFDRNEEKK